MSAEITHLKGEPSRMLEILASQRAGAFVASVTTSAGVSTWLNWIPDDIGKLASLVGIALSVVLMVLRIDRCRREREEHREKMRKPRNGE